jgi:phage shock protein A
MAREALRRQQGSQEIADYYNRAHEQQAQAVTELKSTLQHLGRLLQQAKARRTALFAHREAAQAQQATARSMTRIVGVDSTGAYERLAEDIERDSAQAAALLEVQTAEPEVQFQALQQQEAVEHVLLALKQELGRLPREETAGALEPPEESL